MCFSLNVHVNASGSNVFNDHSTKSKVVKWDKLSKDEICKYKYNTAISLCDVELNHDMILCDNTKCTSVTHQNAITRMYTDITQALSNASEPFVSNTGKHPNEVIGWNEYCKAAHEQARESYLIWRDNNKPRFGILFDNMKKSRAYFKCLFRKCKRDSNVKSADSLANKLLSKNDRDFWKEIKSINNNKMVISDTVNNVSGEVNISNMWRDHFKDILNSSKDQSLKSKVLGALDYNEMSFDRFIVGDVVKAINALKNGKSRGKDSLQAEHFKNADDKLYVLLCMAINAMIIHNFTPTSMLDTILVPLIKDKQGNLSDGDNYRPLALTCVSSKILEFLVLHRYELLLTTNANQFGFKSKLSTEMCIFSLKQLIEYYTMYGSPVYICFLDASKAFDKLNHWLLFSKLLDRGLPCIIVRILINLYSNQRYVVRWASCLSQPFSVTNGAPQGRILSPSFFNVYMDDLSTVLNATDIGCNMNGVNINHMFYADDTVLMATSPTALQSLLNISSVYVKKHELLYNAKKTKCMVFKPKWIKNMHCPKMVLGDSILDYTEEAKYLGCFITNNMSDDTDIRRQIRCIYSRGNTLISKFKQCTIDVKTKLFNSYCSSFYGSNVWSSFNEYTKKKVIVSYKQVFRSFFGFRREGTTSNMLIHKVNPYEVLERKYLYGFLERLNACDNVIVKSIVGAMFFKSTNFYKRCESILYT